MPSPAADAAVRDVVTTEAQWHDLAICTARLPELSLAVTAEAVEQIPEPCEQWIPSPAADAVVRDVVPTEAQWHDLAICTARLPELPLAVTAEAVEQIPEPCEQWIPSPAADAAVRDVVPTEAQWHDLAICTVRLPKLPLAVTAEAVEQIPELCEQWMPSPAAEAAVRDVIPAEATWHDLAICTMRLPGLQLSEAAIATEQIPEPCEQWMPGPAAEAALRDVIPAMAAEYAGTCPVRLPEMRLTIAARAIELVADFRQQEFSSPAASTATAAEWTAPTSATRLPEVRLEVAADTLDRIPAPCEQWMPSPAADAAVRDVIPATASRSVEVCALRLPEMHLAIAPANVERTPECRQQQHLFRPPAAISAMAAERTAQKRSARLPEMRLALVPPKAGQIPERCEEWMPSLPAEAAVRDVIPAVAFQSLELCSTRLPEMLLGVEVDPVAQIPELCAELPASLAATVSPAAPAMAAECAVEIAAARLPEVLVAVPAAGVQTAPGFRPQQIANPPAALPAVAAEQTAQTGATRLPQMLLGVAAEPVQTVRAQVPEACQQMPGLPAEAAVRDVVPAMVAEYRPAQFTVRMPGLQFAIATYLPTLRKWRRAEGPQAAAVAVESQYRTTPLSALRYPSLTKLEPVADGAVQSRPADLAGPIVRSQGSLSACPGGIHARHGGLRGCGRALRTFPVHAGVETLGKFGVHRPALRRRRGGTQGHQAGRPDRDAGPDC